MKKYFFFLSLLLVILSCTTKESTDVFVISDSNGSSNIYIASDADSLIQWAAKELSNDIEYITGKKPEIIGTNSSQGKGIYIGQVSNELMRNIGVPQDSLSDSWESFRIHKKDNKLLIAGSDVRGAVYGIFELAEQLGVSPWQWWADVVPEKRQRLDIKIPNNGIVQSPSVQYRGIFLNDEDWGLQPWAAKNFELETGDIGPKTYEKIFQLLLRLKANTIWPAMHPCTQGFFTVDGNTDMAEKYHMVIGTSHAEPMMRNNVSEWNHDLGEYNYRTNSESINNYWQSRIEEIKNNKVNSIITLGMRGIHDSGMEGISSLQEGMSFLDTIITTQRNMLSNTFQKPITEIPQVFIPYKEVLDIYDEGLQLPEDITLMWTDDNYGYIRRLSNEEEQQRVGGSGVYYHLSYWGRPHDYLWLSTTQPGLIWFEMQKAYANGAHKIWIANVGDIKPGEYTMELFLDMAWDTKSITNTNLNTHLEKWAGREFGDTVAEEVTNVMDEYYRLAFLRKPEYMGWSQTEPTTPTRLTEFSTEAAKARIKTYNELINKTDSLAAFVPKERKAAWFQLVEYPVKGAALLNHKFLYHQLASTNPSSQENYQTKSASAYQKIKELTDEYNYAMRNGKWNHMMSMEPRNLPVFDSLKTPLEVTEISENILSRIEGQFKKASEFNTSNGNWKTIKGFGYSNDAITVFPLTATDFNEEKPWVSYEFDNTEAGDYQLELRFIPTHANNFDHQITIEVNGEPLEPMNLNTKGRSEEWKENVLRNSKIVQVPVVLQSQGKNTFRIYVNQTGIVLDQVALTPAESPALFEIPVKPRD